ncbi:MAG: hypothetical protein ACK56F_32870, partial [bacterium]
MRVKGSPSRPNTASRSPTQASGVGAVASRCQSRSRLGSLVSQQGLPWLRPRPSIRPGPRRIASRFPGRVCTAITRPPTSAGASRGLPPATSNTTPSPGLSAAELRSVHQPWGSRCS